MAKVCCDPCNNPGLSCGGFPLVVPFPSKDEILLISADWNSDGSTNGCLQACFYVNPCYCGRKAELHLLAEVSSPCKKTKEHEICVKIDEFGRFCVKIPKFTRALCLELIIDKRPKCERDRKKKKHRKQKKRYLSSSSCSSSSSSSEDSCEDSCDSKRVLRALFTADLDAPCFIRTVAATPSLQNQAQVGLAGGPTALDDSGFPWKFSNVTGSILEWKKGDFTVSADTPLNLSFVLAASAPVSSEIVWSNASSTGSFFTYLAPVTGSNPLIDTFPENILVGFEPSPALDYTLDYEETFTVQVRDATPEHLVLCEQSFTVRINSQL